MTVGCLHPPVTPVAIGAAVVVHSRPVHAVEFIENGRKLRRQYLHGPLQSEFPPLSDASGRVVCRLGASGLLRCCGAEGAELMRRRSISTKWWTRERSIVDIGGSVFWHENGIIQVESAGSEQTLRPYRMERRVGRPGVENGEGYEEAVNTKRSIFKSRDRIELDEDFLS